MVLLAIFKEGHACEIWIYFWEVNGKSGKCWKWEVIIGNNHSVQNFIGFRDDLVSYSHYTNDKESPFKKKNTIQ